MKHIITFSHQKGGVGKSTLAFNIAQNISKQASVCIVDFDTQGSLSQISEMVEFDILTGIQVHKIEDLNYDFIIIDTPPYLSTNLAELFKISSAVVIPTRAGILDLFAISSTIEILKDVGEQEKGMIVFNLVKPNTTLTSDILKEVSKFNIDIAETYISDLVVYTRSVLFKGVQTSKKAQEQIDSLTKEIIQKII